LPGRVVLPSVPGALSSHKQTKGSAVLAQALAVVEERVVQVLAVPVRKEARVVAGTLAGSI
jgi:hypothetical protein